MTQFALHSAYSTSVPPVSLIGTHLQYVGRYIRIHPLYSIACNYKVSRWLQTCLVCGSIHHCPTWPIYTTTPTQNTLRPCTVYIALYTDTTYTQYIHVYCYMEADTCGVRGVMRVAHIDMRNSSIDCPAPLTQNQLDSGESNTSTKQLNSVSIPSHHFTY